MFVWKEGRQGSGYVKMPLFSSKLFKCDCYLIKVPSGVSVPEHTDPVRPGYKHHRINFTYKGLFGAGQRMRIDGPIKRWWRLEMFRPDLYKHSLPQALDDIHIFSFGWLTND